jgi:hypothetical protein
LISSCLTYFETGEWYFSHNEAISFLYKGYFFFVKCCYPINTLFSQR